MASSWRQAHLLTILCLYTLRDILNADVFRLFFQQLPTKTLYLKGQRCMEVKLVTPILLTGGKY